MSFEWPSMASVYFALLDKSKGRGGEAAPVVEVGAARRAAVAGGGGGVRRCGHEGGRP